MSMEKLKRLIYSRGSANVAIVVVATLLVGAVVLAATTISTDISTGNLTLSGSATTTGNLVVGISTLGTPTSTASFYGNLHVFSGTATSSEALWVGSAGTVNNLSMSGGDLYVQDDVEIDDSLWFVHGTTTDSLAIGGYASTTGDLFVGGGTGYIGTGTATTSPGFYVGPTDGTGTTTLGVGTGGQAGDGDNGCIELVRQRKYYAVYVREDATGLTVRAGRCTDRN